jgi:hypothetical protein
MKVENTAAVSDQPSASSADYAVRVRQACGLIAGQDGAALSYLQSICYAARLMDDAVDADHGPVDYHRLFHVLLVELPVLRSPRGALWLWKCITKPATRQAKLLPLPTGRSAPTPLGVGEQTY